MTIQIDIDEKTLAEVDEAINVLEENRDDVFREAFKELARRKKREAEVRKQYAKAYRDKPQSESEFSDWEEVQDWGE